MTVVLICILISALSNAENSVLYTSGSTSLTETKWKNKGTPKDPKKNINDFGDGTIQAITKDGKTINAMCWDNAALDTIIDFNINPAAAPHLTMEIWMYPYELTGDVWILGNNGQNGNGRGIIVSGCNGIQLGTGNGCTVSHHVPSANANEWTQIVGVWNANTGSAIIYKNGGVLNTDGQQATYSNAHPSHGNPNVAINSAGNGQNLFNGCIARIEIIDRDMTAQEVFTWYSAGAKAFGIIGGAGTGGGGGKGGGGKGGGGGGGTVVVSDCCQTASSKKAAKNCPSYSNKKCETKAAIGLCKWVCSDDNMEGELSVHMNLDSEENGHNKIEIYGLLLFILMSVAFGTYNCWKCTVSKRLLNDREAVFSAYGSV